MRIFDCFMYSDENMILNIRLNVLNEFVDKFIISEALYTHDGSKKKLNFDINNFKKFKNKIEYILVKEPPPNLLKKNQSDNSEKIAEKKIINSLKRENYQREQLVRGIESADNDDLIITSDLDEIPNLKNLNIDQITSELIIFKQKMFYYKLNLFYEGFTWFGPKAIKKKYFVSPQWIRNIKSKRYPFWRLDTFFSNKKYHNVKFIEDGGWHFTCIKKPEDVQKKLLTFLHHQDYEQSNISLEDLKVKMNEKKVLYDHESDKSNPMKWDSNKELTKINIESLPLYLINNQEEYSEWLEN